MKKHTCLTTLLVILFGMGTGMGNVYAHDMVIVRHDDLVELDCVRPSTHHLHDIHDNAQASCLLGDGNTAIIHQENKQGLIDKNGTLRAPIKYDDIIFRHDISVVQVGDKYGFIHTKTGKEVTPIHFEDVGFLEDNLINVKLNSNWGYIDATGKTVIPFKYGSAYRFEHGLALVSNHGYVKEDTYRVGLIDKNGKEVFAPIYRSIIVSGDKIYFTDEAGLQGVSDLQGNPLIAPQYPILGAFAHGYAPFALLHQALYGYLNEKGEEVIAPQYIDAKAPHQIGDEVLFVVAKQTHQGAYWGVVDKDNQTVIDFIYTDLRGQFNENFLLAQRDDGQYLLIDKRGTPLISKTYDFIADFYEEVSEYSLDGKYGLISLSGKEITPAIYDYISHQYSHDNTIHYGMIVSQNDKLGFLNPKGQEILPAIYEDIVVKDALIYVKQGSLYGVASMTGETLVPPKYTDIQMLADGHAKVQDDGVWYLLDAHGNTLGRTSPPKQATLLAK